MPALYQLSDGSEGAQPDGLGSHQNGSGSINLSDSEAEQSAQLLSAFPDFPESKGQTIHLTGGVFTPNVAAQLPVPPAIMHQLRWRRDDESSSPAQLTNRLSITSMFQRSTDWECRRVPPSRSPALWSLSRRSRSWRSMMRKTTLARLRDVLEASACVCGLVKVALLVYIV